VSSGAHVAPRLTAGTGWREDGIVIEVVEYDERWPELFGQLSDRYRELLDGVEVVAIEHVGSTSVHGLVAKPVIDVDVVVEREHLAAALAAFADAGFELRGDLGIEDRHAVVDRNESIRTNTYVVVAGSLALRNHLAVRDVLRADAELRTDYGELKQQLAASINDVDLYVAAKSPVLQRILARAGMSDDDRVRIADANVAAPAASREPVGE
jgi:GrpB-like predicted nucleotidyltransferase (UPF0157 family)